MKKIKIIGVGGCGVNAVNRITQSGGLGSVELIGIDTDNRDEITKQSPGRTFSLSLPEWAVTSERIWLPLSPLSQKIWGL